MDYLKNRLDKIIEGRWQIIRQLDDMGGERVSEIVDSLHREIVAFEAVKTALDGDMTLLDLYVS